MSKELSSKEVKIKAHVRVIKQRLYRFVCKGCDKVVERVCYPTKVLYCEHCRPPKVTHKPKSVVPVKKKKNKVQLPVISNFDVAAG